MQFQIDRSLVLRREKEINVRAELADAARNTVDDSESRIEQLEVQLQKSIIEKNDLGLKMEEAIQDSGEEVNYASFYLSWNLVELLVVMSLFIPGRKDIKAEFRVMASALSKEMGMMEAQLNRWKETANEALSLREKTVSLKVSLSTKVYLFIMLVFSIICYLFE